MTERAFVLHSGLQHAEHVAIGFKMAGQLDMFATASLVPYNDQIANCLRVSPRMFRMYLNRSSRQLSHDEILSVSRFEAVERVMHRICWSYPQKRAVTHWRDRAMSRHISQRLPNRVNKLYSFPNVALDAFRVGRSRGTRLLLDLPIGHFRAALRIAKEERSRFPELADTFSFDAPPPRFERRFSEELELADVLVCGSRFVRNSFIAEGVPEERLVKVKYGSSLPSLTESEAEERRARLAIQHPGPLRVIFVGQFSQRKGLGYLLEAIRNSKKMANIHFTMIGSFVGSKDWFDTNRDIIDELVVRASRERLRNELLAADVLFFPSLFEGSALVVHEAAALGLPIVTTENAGVDFVADKCIGEIHPIRDVGRHTDTLTRFAEDRTYLAATTERAISHSVSATWDAFYKAVPTL